MDPAVLYRGYGPAILARCRRLLGDDEAAARATPRVFVHVQRRLTGVPADDAPLLDGAAAEVCAGEPGPRLLREPGPPSDEELRRAHERFAADVYRRTLPLVERDQRPPIVLRWLWIYAPILVTLAMTGMFYAVRNPMSPERFGGGSGAAHLELYDAAGARLTSGKRVRRGDRLGAVVVPAGFAYATVLIGPRVHQRLGPLARDAGRLQVTPIVVDESPLRVGVMFGSSPRGLPVREASIVLDVE